MNPTPTEIKPPAVWRTLLLLGAALAVLLILVVAIWWFAEPQREISGALLRRVAIQAGIAWVFLFTLSAGVWLLAQLVISAKVQQQAPLLPVAATQEPAEAPSPLAALSEHLHDSHGYFWRRRVRLLAVLGEPDEIEALAPGLAKRQWLEEPASGSVLLWGGSLTGSGQSPWLENLRELSRFRPLDGIVCALSEAQRDDAQGMGNGALRLCRLARQLRWRAPLYLWQVCRSDWAQAERRQSVGCLLPAKASAEKIESSLRQLLAPLRTQGIRQMTATPSHDFLLRLSHDLEQGGVAQWRDALAPLLTHFAQGMPLRGLLFGLPQKPNVVVGMEHAWWPGADWDALRGDEHARGRAFGWTWLRGAQVALLSLAGLGALATVLSFAGNRSQIATAQAALAQLQQGGSPERQLAALDDLVEEMAQMDERRANGVPWHLRFGLSQNDALLASLWAPYAQANNRLLRDGAAQLLETQLRAFVAEPGSSPERAQTAHEQLKAYLMMARPERVDAALLSRVLGRSQGVRPGLWKFYAEHLEAHPDWRIEADAEVVARVRKVLLGQLAQRGGVDSLYGQVLDAARNNHVDLSLRDMVGEADASSLFDSPNSVPGMFTREAWEGDIRRAIDEIAQARREEIDWVLSDDPQSVAAELRPEALKTQLTERYFKEYADAWLGFMASVRWRRAQSLDESIEQLALLADRRRSPLTALINALADQGSAGSGRDRADAALATRAGDAAGAGQQAAIAPPAGPLDSTFGPVRALLAKRAMASAKPVEGPTLEMFLARVDRLRLELQQIQHAPDPESMTRMLGQGVLQGRTLDHDDARAYGNRIASRLGSAHGAFGQNLFVQPFDQASETLLQASAQQLNILWQREIVADWSRQFAGRYPFAPQGADASLPLLGQMIRPDGGRIDRFIGEQLGGVLRKEGTRWVADAASGQNLNPRFLAAVNRLGALADLLYTDGSMGMTFQLQAKPVHDVVQTTLIVDGERLEYFNQMEFWQSFRWPSRIDHPGASLTWSSVRTGARLYADHPGLWGVVRLLEKARVTPLEGSGELSRLELMAADGLPLTWYMRSKGGRGPLAFLQLRDFELPREIFRTGMAQAAPTLFEEPL